MINRRRYVIPFMILTFILDFSSQISGQNLHDIESEIDSILSKSYELRKSNSDVSLKAAFSGLTKANEINNNQRISVAYERIGSAYRYLNVIDSAIYYLKKGIYFDQKNGLAHNVTSKYNNLALTFKHTNWSFDSAKFYFQACIYSAKANLNNMFLAKAQNNLANLYNSFGFHEDALKTYLENLSLRERIRDTSGLVSTTNNLGNFFAKQQKFDKALFYYQYNLSISLAIKDSLALALAYSNIGTILYDSATYDSTYTTDHRLGDLIIPTSSSVLGIGSDILIDSALVNFSFARKIYGGSQSRQYKYRLAGILNNIGNVMLAKKDWDRSIEYYVSSIDLYKSIDENYKLGEVYNNLGNAFRLTGHFSSSLTYFKKAYIIANQTSNIKLEMQLSWNIAKTLKEMGLHNEAFDFVVDYHFKNYELTNVEKAKVIRELEAIYQTEKNEHQISLQQSEINTRIRERNGLIITLIVALSLTLVILFLYQQRQNVQAQLRKKDRDIYEQKVDEILKEQEIITLNASLESQEKERKRIAVDLHDRLGSMLASAKLHCDAATSSLDQGIIKKTKEILDDTITETRKIAHNLTSGVLTKFGLSTALETLKDTIEQSKQIGVEVFINNLDDRLSNDLEIALYRIVQESVSNVLKHANASQLIIQLTRHNDGHLTLMIEDDGIGFNPTSVPKNMGLKNIKARISNFEGELRLDSKTGHGTTITIDIPNQP